MATSLVGPDGKEYVLDNEDPAALARARELGYRSLAEGEERTTGEALKAGVGEASGAVAAGVEGGLQGASAGLYGTMLGAKKHDEETDDEFRRRQYEAQEYKRRQEEHGIVSGVGNAAGMLVSPVGEIGKLAGAGVKATTALGRIGAGVVTGGTEGALFGVGNTVSDSVLGDHELTAEKLIAGGGLGMVLGVAGGGAGAAIGEGVSALTPKLAKGLEGAKENIADFASNRWLKAGGGTQRDLASIPEGSHDAVAGTIRKHMGGDGFLGKSLEDTSSSISAARQQAAQGVMEKIGVGDAGGLRVGMGRDEAVTAIDAALEKNGQQIGQALEKADASGVRPEYWKFHKRFDGFKESLNPAERDLIQGDLKKVEGYLYEMGMNPVGSEKSGFSALNDIKSTIQKDINWTADGAAKTDLKRQLAGILRDEIDTQVSPVLGSDLAKEFIDAKNAFGKLTAAEKALAKKSATGTDALDAMIEKSGLEAGATRELETLGHAEKLVKHGLERQAGNRFVSPSDYGVGLASAVMPGGTGLKALGMTLTHKFVREKGSVIIAKLADKLAESPQLSVMAASFAKKAAEVAPVMEQYAPILAQAAARGPQQALATHMVLAQVDPHYAMVAQRAGFTPEDGQQGNAALQKAHGIASIAGAVAAHDEDLDRHIDKVLKGVGKPAAVAVMNGQDFGTRRMRKEGVEAHGTRVEEVRQLAGNPDALIDRITNNLGNLHNVAPGVAAALTNTANGAVQYLAKAAQHPLPAGPLAPPWHPSEAERHEFAQKLEVVEDPMSALRHAAAGTLTGAQMEAFKTVYPTLARTVADKVIDKITSNPKSVPYKSRVMIGLLTGIDPDGTMGPAAIAANQAAIHRASEKPSNAGTPSGPQTTKPTAKGAEKLTLANRTATPSQAREMRQE